MLLAAAGVWAALSLPVSLFPDIQFPRLVVSVNAGDRPVDRMAIEVTQPLERALRSVPSVVDIRSTSSRGSADISVNFNWGTDMITALLQAQSAVNNLLPTLPAGTTFTARRLNPTVFPILGLALTSKTRDPVSLRDFAYYKLRRNLSTIPGIARIEALGGQQEEYEVLLSPARLLGLGLSIDDVARSLSASNVVTAVGRLVDRSRLFLIVSSAPMKTLADIRSTIVHSGADGIVKLEDVAEVTSGAIPNLTAVAANGKDAVLLNFYQQPGADTVAIGKSVKAAIALTEVPSDITITPYYDQSELVVASEHSVRDAIGIGAAFAALILYLFLKNWRVTLIIAAMLPIVLTATILVLHVLHMSFNMMTLGGMAAAVGLIIDDGVVMLEHISRRVQGDNGDGDPGAVSVKATLEMARPLLSSSLATTVIFLPLAFLGGVSGGFFKALALTMASALFISFFIAFFALPPVARFLLAGNQKEHKQPVMHWLGKRYERVMTRFLQHPIWVIPLLFVLGAGGYFAFTAVGTGFLPSMDEGGFIIDYRAPPGTSLSETERLLRQVDKIIESTPEVDSYSRRTGLQLGGGLTEANSGDFFVRLKSQRSRSIFAVMASVREQVKQQVPGLDFDLSQLIEDLIGDLTAVPQPIEIKLFSTDPKVLRDLPPKVAEVIRRIDGVVGVNDGIVIAGDSIDIEINRVNAALEGMDPRTITTQIQGQLGGTVASQIPAQEKIIGVRVRSPEDLRARIAQVQQLTLRAPDGHVMPLKRVAQVRVVTGQAQLDRENERTLVAVTARIVGRSLGVTVQDVKAAIDKMNLPSGVTVEYGGLYQQQQKSSHDLTIVFASAVLLVAVLLLFVYERFAVVVSILITAMLTLIGVFAGLWITGTSRNITSMMGMTMIIGMVTEIAIFYFAELEVSEQPDSKALIAAGMDRMRAILMSALIAILSLLPLALTLGSGSGMLKPLAIAIISGLVVAVPLVLLLMPAIYSALNGAVGKIAHHR